MKKKYQEPEPLGKKNQEPEPEPLEKKSGVGKKFAGSPALVYCIHSVCFKGLHGMKGHIPEHRGAGLDIKRSSSNFHLYANSKLYFC